MATFKPAVASVTGTAPVVSSGGLNPAISLPAATAAVDGYATSSQITKLDGIETGADVTDTTNVDAAGATMNADTNVKSNGWVKDENDMASDDDTKVPTQQSVKAYVDGKAQSSIINNEVPGGTINGSNQAFTTASAFVTGSLKVYKNGVRMKGGGADFTEDASGFTMVTAPVTGTVLLVDYKVGDGSGLEVGTNSLIVGEVPSGTVAGGTVFTTARAYIAGSLEVFINGLAQARTTHFTETTPGSGIFTMSDALSAGDVITVNYQFNLNPSSNSDTIDGIHANAIATPNNLMPLDANGKFSVANLYNPYKASVYLSGDQTINDATATLIAFDTEEYDTSGNFNNTAGNYKWVAPITGYYHVDCDVQLTDATGKYVAGILYTYKDATQIGYCSQNPYPAISTASGFGFGFHQTVYLTAGQTISFKAYVDTSDAGSSVVAGGAGYSRCSFTLVSAL